MLGRGGIRWHWRAW